MVNIGEPNRIIWEMVGWQLSFRCFFLGVLLRKLEVGKCFANKKWVGNKKRPTPTERVGRVIDFLLVCVFLLKFLFLLASISSMKIRFPSLSGG